MNPEKNGNDSAGSDVEGESGGEGAGATTATIPKKRGRPPKGGVKVEKVPSGRGRGRPAKQGGKPKAIQPASGKGRGRPKVTSKANDDAADIDDEDYPESPLAKKAVGRGTPRRSPGRPRKSVQASDEDDDNEVDDEEEQRVVGRPATGAVNLNISRTGRGQGRPKKAASPKKRVAESSPNGSAKKRGRPGKTTTVAASGRGRGKPKPVSSEEEEEDSKDDESRDSFKSPLKGDESVESVESIDSDEEITNSGKKHRELSAEQLAAA